MSAPKCSLSTNAFRILPAPGLARRRENDPARGMLTRFYGSEWTEAVIGGVLFDYSGAEA